ncbi:hypothetical protein BCR35DRAFT_323462 [Leucosporidium creatinivorum]|uniref:Uncharacterized protein n=1 Tax=Leucosporidium creatinivorum TaxID=106004 RepID=A0A1Y2G5M3_9BASI|nr:hypothetical protein BCR35DRAFT_323462 [Leucosporidium creatinivorum]
MSFPTPPEGIDPFDFYSELFRPPFHPSPGYQARLIVLGVFIASLPISATLLFGLHALKARRRGEKLWLFKRVKRPAGSYIVGARTPLLALTALIVAGTLGGALWTGWRFTSNFALTADPFNDCMYSYWILSFIAGWTYSCSNFQTWVLVSGERRAHLSPRIANLIFFGGLFLGSSVLLGVCIYGGLLTQAFYNKQDVLFDYLEEIGRNYNGTFEPTILGDLAPLAAAYGTGVVDYFSTFPAILAILSASPAPVILVNTSALFLWLILRRQGRENREVEAIKPTGPAATTLGNFEKLSGSSRRHKEMKAIEHGFLVDAIAVCLWSSSILIGGVWTASIFKHVETAGWSRIEAGLFLPVWSASVPLAIAMVAQTILAWQGLPPSRGSSAEGSDPDAPSFPQPRSMEEMRRVDVQSVELGSSRVAEKTGRHELLEFGEGREGKDEEAS